jgi:hypothetical protein
MEYGYAKGNFKGHPCALRKYRVASQYRTGASNRGTNATFCRDNLTRARHQLFVHSNKRGVSRRTITAEYPSKPGQTAGKTMEIAKAFFRKNRIGGGEPAPAVWKGISVIDF